MSKALIVVDVQNDFCEGGALAVEGGNEVAESIARYIANSDTVGLYSKVVFTADWHKAPPDTNGGHFGDPPDFVDSWPVHCVADTEGSEFHPEILKAMDAIPDFRSDVLVFRKGHGSPDYSGFQGFNEWGDGLGFYLMDNDITEVHVCGLAGDYCVKETAKGAVDAGLDWEILGGLVASVRGNEATILAIDEVVDYEFDTLLKDEK